MHIICPIVQRPMPLIWLPWRDWPYRPLFPLQGGLAGAARGCDRTRGAGHGGRKPTGRRRRPPPPPNGKRSRGTTIAASRKPRSWTALRSPPGRPQRTATTRAKTGETDWPSIARQDMPVADAARPQRLSRPGRLLRLPAFFHAPGKPFVNLPGRQKARGCPKHYGASS